MSLNVIDDRAHVVKEWRFVSPPACVMVGEWPGESTLPDQPLQVPHHWREYYRTSAPVAQPAITAEDFYLKDF